MVGALEMRPYQDPVWHGQIILLSPAERALLWTLLKANGRSVSQYVLADRIGYEGEHLTQMMGVYLCRMRSKFGAVAPFHLVSRKGRISLDPAQF